jgi:hypothetical protein
LVALVFRQFLQLLRTVNTDKDSKRKRDVIKKVIAYMTLGIDVSRLFSDMILVRIIILAGFPSSVRCALMARQQQGGSAGRPFQLARPRELCSFAGPEGAASSGAAETHVFAGVWTNIRCRSARINRHNSGVDACGF